MCVLEYARQHKRIILFRYHTQFSSVFGVVDTPVHHHAKPSNNVWSPLTTEKCAERIFCLPLFLRRKMPMIAILALIDRKPRCGNTMVVFRDSCRHLRFLARLITNLLGLADPAFFGFKLLVFRHKFILSHYPSWPKIISAVIVIVVPAGAVPESTDCATKFSTVFWTIRRIGRAPSCGS